MGISWQLNVLHLIKNTHKLNDFKETEDFFYYQNTHYFQAVFSQGCNKQYRWSKTAE